MMLKTKPKNDQAELQFVYDVPAVAEAMQRRDSLRQRLADLQSQMLETDGGDQHPRGRLAEEAIALAGGVAVAPRVDLHHEEAVAQKALAIVEAELADEIARASGLVIATARPQHDAIMRRIGEALSDLTTAVREEDALVSGLRAGGVVGVGDLSRPDCPTLCGDLFRRLRLLDFAEWKQRLGVEL